MFFYNYHVQGTDSSIDSVDFMKTPEDSEEDDSSEDDESSKPKKVRITDEVEEQLVEDDENENAAGDEADGRERFSLPTPEQREEEKKRGGPDVQEVQLRMQECAKVLSNFKRYGDKSR